MVILYRGSGSGSFSLSGRSCSPEQLRRIKHNANLMLKSRGEEAAATYVQSIDFEIRDATNDFWDEFSVLYAEVPLDLYETLRTLSAEESQGFRAMAEVFSEVGPFIRFVALEVALEEPPRVEDPAEERRLTKPEISKLVYKYIGVDGGYLADFSYRSHHEFYIELDLDINPYSYDGTTRQKFITILSQSPADTQARILEGIIRRYPVGSSPLRTEELHNEIQAWIRRIRGLSPLATPSLRISTETVKIALSDAEHLLKSSGATSAIDRMHTALHGYILAVCYEAGIKIDNDNSLTHLFKVLRTKHPAFLHSSQQTSEIGRMINSLGTIVDSMNTLRNKASIAHPNPDLLGPPEAMLVVNTARTILHYVDEKIGATTVNKST